MDDHDIVAMYLDRSEKAIAETKVKYQKYLLKVAFNICGDKEDARECVSDAYLAAWNSIPPHHPKHLLSYLSKLTRRIAIDSFRRKSREKRRASQYAISLEELDECIPDENSLEKEIDEKLLAEMLNEFLRQLDTEKKDIFLERYYYADSVKDIASRHNSSQSRIKSALFRLRDQLRDHLRKGGYYEQ